MTPNNTRRSTAIAERAEGRESGPTIAELITKQAQQIERAVPRHVSADRLARIALTELRRTPRLNDCTPQSVLGAVMLCSQLGLEPGGPLGQAFLVPFRNSDAGTTECQFVLGYKGIIDLAFRSGRMVDIQAREVHEADAFAYRYGLAEQLDHTPARGERGAVVAYWALARFTGGGHVFTVMSPADVELHRARSKAKDAGPWRTDYDAMAKKTAVRTLAPFLPMSAELAEQLATDEAVVRDLPMTYSDVIDVGELAGTTDAPPTEAERPAQTRQPRRRRAAEAPSTDAAPGATNAPASGTAPDAGQAAGQRLGEDAPGPPGARGEMISPEQGAQIAELFDRAQLYAEGEAGQPDRLRYVSTVVGRSISDGAELTADEAAAVIASLHDVLEAG
jgi:recombination protein RecT